MTTLMLDEFREVSMAPGSLPPGTFRRLGSGRVLGVCLSVLVLRALLAQGAEDPIRARVVGAKPPPPVRGEVLVQPSPEDEPRDVHDDERNRLLYFDSRLYTRRRGSAQVHLEGNHESLEVGPGSELRFVRRYTSPLELVRGLFYFFARGKAPDLQFETPHLVPGHAGTDFTVSVDDEQTVVTVLDGYLYLTNRVVLPGGATTNHVLVLSKRHQQAILSSTSTPQVPEVTNLVQWWAYYPAVIDIRELPFDPLDRARLDESLRFYSLGRLDDAEGTYLPPPGSQPGAAESVYLAALALTRGRTDVARAALANAGSLPSLGRAIEHVIEAATGSKTPPGESPPSTASEWLGYSYRLQSLHDLEGARRAARQALDLDATFHHARLRLAELRFMLGDRRGARVMLEDMDSLAHNAAYHGLFGFVLAAENRMREASVHFERAIELDSGYADGWLGRGLVRIRRGGRENLRSGREDLLAGMLAEPGRAFPRSYLAKAYQMERAYTDSERALEYASELDLLDPTPWLYLALLHQEENRINEGIRALHGSLERNDNRRVYRSRLNLDQDRAVRGANLALLYRDAGLAPIGLREASKALAADYANSSAHLFLADSFNNLRDPRQTELRYETAWFGEYLLANLLGPVGAGTLSPTVTVNEYSRLFDRQRIGVSSITEYRSGGDWLQAGAIHGFHGRTDAAFDTLYLEHSGDRPGADFTSCQFAATVKQEVDPDDDLFFRVLHYRYEAGDVRPLYDDSESIPGLKVEDTREPEILLGHHHAWQPGHHTLFLAALADDRLAVFNPSNQIPVTSIQGDQIRHAPARGSNNSPQTLRLVTETSLASFEAQQVAVFGSDNAGSGRHLLVAGARFQPAWFETRYDLGEGRSYSRSFAQPNSTRPWNTASFAGVSATEMQRLSGYLYDTWEPTPRLAVTGGLVYDHLRYPINFRYAPTTDQTRTADEISPKAGIVYRPWSGADLRAAYTRSLAGPSFDSSFRIEPTQVGGFNQAFRTLIPESAFGTLASAATLETTGLAWDQAFGESIFVSFAGQRLASAADFVEGALQAAPGTSLGHEQVVNLARELDFEEFEFAATVDWLVDTSWSFGLRYRLDQAELQVDAPRAHPAIARHLELDRRSLLHEFAASARFNTSSGFFAITEARFLDQELSGSSRPGPGESTWQWDAWFGYRFLQRRAEVRLGVLNLTDDFVRLDPMNVLVRPPRSRTFTAGLRFAF